MTSVSVTRASVPPGTVTRRTFIEICRVIRNELSELRPLIASISPCAGPPRRKLNPIASIAERVAALKPDLIVLTGDIADSGMGGEARVGAGLKAPQGVFAVMGNHEFYHGLEDSARILQGMGARVLRNEDADLPCGIQLVGVDDIRTARVSRQEVSELFSRLDPGKPSIFLSHQPLDFDLAAKAGVGLMLSGHTHQGQIWPFGLIVRLFYPRFHGLYEENKSWLYVTSGTGQWGPPMRLFTRAEIVRIQLRAPKN